MPWLIDTNAWIHYLKHADSPVGVRLRGHPSSEIKVCSVVYAELMYGALRYGAPERRRTVVLEALAAHESYPFDDPAAERYAEIRHDLEASGQVIGGNDMQIAAIALSHDCTIATGNVDEFRRVRGLRVENWLLPSS